MYLAIPGALHKTWLRYLSILQIPLSRKAGVLDLPPPIVDLLPLPLALFLPRDRSLYFLILVLA